MSPLSLATPCLNIRTMKPADLSDFLKYRADPEVVQFQSFDVMTGQHEFAMLQREWNVLKP